MKHQIRKGATALVLLLAGAGLAAAAGNTAMASKDRLSLTSTQQHTIFQSVKSQGTKEALPSGFKAAIGEALPASLTLRPLPGDATSKVPAVKSYDYVMLQNELLIVNPKDRKIVDILMQ